MKLDKPLDQIDDETNFGDFVPEYVDDLIHSIVIVMFPYCSLIILIILLPFLMG